MRPQERPNEAQDPLTIEEQVAWEMQAVLAWHDEDAKAAIKTLLLDCRHLRTQLATAEILISRGMGRGWRPLFDRAADQG
ncbi:hypothetical protein [Rhizobium sp. RAF56]|uniref:hypothetical protein n=1 Tax=Rhizobium sp. RAF56 TaxID=3233062 RepID=UPI003F94B37D